MLLKRIAEYLPPHLRDLLPALGEWNVHDIISTFAETPADGPTVDSAEIRSTEHLIFTDPSTIQGLVPNVQPHFLEAISAHCLSLTAPPSVTGDRQSALDRNNKGKGRRWAGWDTDILNELLEGWDGVGVLEIAGPRRAGKTVYLICAARRRRDTCDRRS